MLPPTRTSAVQSSTCLNVTLSMEVSYNGQCSGITTIILGIKVSCIYITKNTYVQGVELKT